MPVELYRWVKGLATLRHTSALIIPGTGVLTDVLGLRGFGPYSVFKWALIAKICRCKLIFLSVGAGPLHSRLGRLLVRTVLSMADFRSYRDHSSREYLGQIGFHAENDGIYPDLAFSLSETLIPRTRTESRDRPVVGIGLMSDSKRYGTAGPDARIHGAYLEALAGFVKWLIARGFDVRLLIGDLLDDMNVTREFKRHLDKQLSSKEQVHVLNEPIGSFTDLLSQIEKTDFLVATRFHNLVFGFLCNKPVISISFHHKCDSLMSAMGLTAYCLNINELTADMLIATFCDLTRNAHALKSIIADKTRQHRKALDEQYLAVLRYV
jgi:polysaccharide pyruvyl transferase WcaK-like protein